MVKMLNQSGAHRHHHEFLGLFLEEYNQDGGGSVDPRETHFWYAGT
jgi:hypothetical protein